MRPHQPAPTACPMPEGARVYGSHTRIVPHSTLSATSVMSTNGEYAGGRVVTWSCLACSVTGGSNVRCELARGFYGATDRPPFGSRLLARSSKVSRRLSFVSRGPELSRSARTNSARKSAGSASASVLSSAMTVAKRQSPSSSPFWPKSAPAPKVGDDGGLSARRATFPSARAHSRSRTGIQPRHAGGTPRCRRGKSAAVHAGPE